MRALLSQFSISQINRIRYQFLTVIVLRAQQSIQKRKLLLGFLTKITSIAIGNKLTLINPLSRYLSKYFYSTQSLFRIFYIGSKFRVLSFFNYNLIVIQCKGYYCSYLRLPLGQPPDTPQTSISYVPEARARSIQSPRSLRPYLFKDLSLSLIYPVLIISLQPPIYKFPLYLNSSYSIQKGSQL